MTRPMRNALSQPVNGYGLMVLLIVCISLAGLGMVQANAARHNTERKFCALLMQSENRAERQLAAYDESPPSTEAGRAQRDEVIISLGQLTRLERQLGCPRGKRSPQ